MYIIKSWRMKSKVVNSVLFRPEHPEYVVSVLHPVQETPLKRTCKYFGRFGVFWE